MSRDMDIDTKFLNNIFFPEHSFKLENCGFLNSESTKKIGLYNKNIRNEMMVSVIIDKKECAEIPSEKIYGHWDYLLITLFGFKFTVKRIKSDCSLNSNSNTNTEVTNQFIIKSGSGDKVFKVNRAYLDKQNEKDKNEPPRVEITKSGITLSSYNEKDRLESISCKTAILYIISQAYPQEMQRLTEKVSNITLTENKSYLKGFFIRCKKITRLFIKICSRKKNKLNNYNDVLKEILDFRVKFLSDMPLEIDKAYTTFEIWKKLKETFYLSEFISELDNKQKTLIDYKRDEFQRKASSLGLRLAILALLLTAVSAVNDGNQLYNNFSYFHAMAFVVFIVILLYSVFKK